MFPARAGIEIEPVAFELRELMFPARAGIETSRNVTSRARTLCFPRGRELKRLWLSRIRRTQCFPRGRELKI